MSKLTDWMRKNPPETVDLTVEDLAPKRGDKQRLESETNSITNRIVFYEGEALRYREMERLASESAAECERLAAAYQAGLGALQQHEQPRELLRFPIDPIPPDADPDEAARRRLDIMDAAS